MNVDLKEAIHEVEEITDIVGPMLYNARTTDYLSLPALR